MSKCRDLILVWLRFFLNFMSFSLSYASTNPSALIFLIIIPYIYIPHVGWNHRHKNYMVVVMDWLAVTKYPLLEWYWIFLLISRLFSYIGLWVTHQVYYKKQELHVIHICKHLASLTFFFGGFCVSYLFSPERFCCCNLFCKHFWINAVHLFTQLSKP